MNIHLNYSEFAHDPKKTDLWQFNYLLHFFYNNNLETYIDLCILIKGKRFFIYIANSVSKHVAFCFTDAGILRIGEHFWHLQIYALHV